MDKNGNSHSCERANSFGMNHATLSAPLITTMQGIVLWSAVPKLSGSAYPPKI